MQLNDQRACNVTLQHCKKLKVDLTPNRSSQLQSEFIMYMYMYLVLGLCGFTVLIDIYAFYEHSL